MIILDFLGLGYRTISSAERLRVISTLSLRPDHADVLRSRDKAPSSAGDWGVVSLTLRFLWNDTHSLDDRNNGFRYCSAGERTQVTCSSVWELSRYTDWTTKEWRISTSFPWERGLLWRCSGDKFQISGVWTTFFSCSSWSVVERWSSIEQSCVVFVNSCNPILQNPIREFDTPLDRQVRHHVWNPNFITVFTRAWQWKTNLSQYTWLSLWTLSVVVWIHCGFIWFTVFYFVKFTHFSLLYQWARSSFKLGNWQFASPILLFSRIVVSCIWWIVIVQFPCACCVIPVSCGYVNQNPFPCITLRLFLWGHWIGTFVPGDGNWSCFWKVVFTVTPKTPDSAPSKSCSLQHNDG